jgi:hypothetical protein
MKSVHAGRLTMFLVLVLTPLAYTGCSKDGPPEFDVAPVTGTVKLKGVPLADADVSFRLEGVAPTGFIGSAAKTDASGKYELRTNDQKGAPPGNYKVSVSKYVDKDGNVPKVDPEAGMDLEQLIQGGVAVQAVPAPYNSPEDTQKTAEVVAGKDNVIDIEIP